jgi:hypothetical protein
MSISKLEGRSAPRVEEPKKVDVFPGKPRGIRLDELVLPGASVTDVRSLLSRLTEIEVRARDRRVPGYVLEGFLKILEEEKEEHEKERENLARQFYERAGFDGEAEPREFATEIEVAKSPAGYLYVLSDSALPEYARIGWTGDLPKAVERYNSTRPEPTGSLLHVSLNFPFVKESYRILKKECRINKITITNNWVRYFEVSRIIQIISHLEKTLPNAG